MRNLKRVLSLALALVMVLGMMVIGTSAATYADAEKIDYTEAVDVMSALEVLEGDGTNYNPDDILTREQAAKIIAFMLMGKDKATKLTGTGSFTDVAATRWSAGYIDYCASLDILAGNGDGTYDPTGKLTGVAFAKMLLIALGYDAKVEGYVNNGNWATNISSDAIDVGLDVKGVLLADYVSREVAAQMALQALEKTMVKYASKGSTITVNGVEIVSGASAAEAVTYAEAGGYDYKTGANDAAQYATVQFCEKYFPNLSLDAVTGDDDFNRPGQTWTIQTTGLPISVFAGKKAVATYTDKALTKTVPGMKNVLAELKDYYLVNGGTKYKVSAKVGVSPITFTNLVATNGVDGDLVAAAQVHGVDQTFADAIAGLTADNLTVEVYATPQKVINKIVVVETYVDSIGTVTEANEANGTKASVTLNTNSTYTFETDAFAKDDVVLFTYAAGEVQSMTKAASFVGTLTTYAEEAFSTVYTIGGTEYEVWSGATSSALNTAIKNYIGIPKTYFLGQNNMIVAVDAVKGAAAAFDGYALISDAAFETKTVTLVGTVKTGISVAAVLSDGTQGIFTLPAVQNKDKSWTITVGTTEIDLAANADNTDLLTALGGAGAVYSYTLADNTLTLVADIADHDDSTLTVSGVKTVAGTGITKASTTISNVLTDKTIVANENTVFILNDERTDAVITKTGIAALEATTSFNGTVVVNVTAYKDKAGNLCNSLVAAYVFAPTKDFASSSATVGVNDYVYVDGTYVVTKDAITKLPVYTATGYKADGTTIALEKGNEAAGIYKFNSDSELDNTSNFGTEATVVSINGTTVGLKLANTSVVYLTVNSTTKTVSVARGATLAVGATVCYYDVVPSGGSADGVIDLLYVTEAAE